MEERDEKSLTKGRKIHRDQSKMVHTQVRALAQQSFITYCLPNTTINPRWEHPFQRVAITSSCRWVLPKVGVGQFPAVTQVGPLFLLEFVLASGYSFLGCYTSVSLLGEGTCMFPCLKSYIQKVAWAHLAHPVWPYVSCGLLAAMTTVGRKKEGQVL